MSVSAMRVPPRDDVAGLYDRIGAFLVAHRLSPEPANYAFAYQVLSDPSGPLAAAVDAITDGGVRLTGQDIASLGGVVLQGPPLAVVERRMPDPDETPCGEDQRADALIARTQFQVNDFADTVRSIHAETSGFGRDLVASAAAMRDAASTAMVDEVARLTGTMIERVRSTEVRLAEAQRETDELREALDEARGSARRDPLTDLANRRAFDEAFAALAPDAPVAIAVCDIDHFKRVNDEFGHAVGDRVLKAIAQTLASECECGLVARYGGEEFALLFTGTAIADVAAVLDRARSAVAARRFRVRETAMSLGTVTLSGGFAVGVAVSGQHAILARADAALYRAKAAGRNRIMTAPENGE